MGKSNMELLGESIADGWFQQILTYYCKQTKGSVEEVLQMLIKVNEQIVLDYCKKNWDLIDRDDAVEECENQGFTVEGN
jgi:hypothetical protein